MLCDTMADRSTLNKIFAKKEPERPQAGRRLTLSTPMLAAICLVFAAAVAWAFYMGYMVGQGQNPQESIQEITGLSASTEAEANAEREDLKDSPAANAMPASGQIPPLAPMPMPAVSSPLAAKPQGESAKAWPDPAGGAQASNLQEAPKQKANNQRFNYVFQVAAIRNLNEAQKMQKTLAAKKVRASLRKSGKVNLVIVELRGTEADVEQLKDKLKAAHLGKPLQLSKKPVEARTNKRK